MSREDDRRSKHSRHGQEKRKIQAERNDAANNRAGEIQGEVGFTLSQARGFILKALNEFVSTPNLSAENTVLMVARGDARMAAMYLPEETVAQGTKGICTMLCNRERLIKSFSAIDVNLVNVLSTPWECGKDRPGEVHLQALITTSLGGAIQCTHCDLGIRQKARAKA